MKNNFNLFIFKVSFFILIIFESVLAQSFQFEAEIIETNDDNFIVASNNVVIKDVFGAKIFGDKVILDKVNKIYTISGNVTYEDKTSLIIINADKIIYNDINKIINSEGPTTLKKDNLYKIQSSDII